MSDEQQQSQPQPEVVVEQKRPSAVLATRVSGGMALQPQSFGELVEFAKIISTSGMVPKQYINNVGAILVAIQMGAEVGLGPMAALQNIAVINGRPAVWGDAGLAIVKMHPEFLGIWEDAADTGATCKISRRGHPDVIRSFTLDDAKLAGLLGKEGPWQQYRKRMMQMRARWLAMRDQFPDALRGMGAAEDEADRDEIDVTPVIAAQRAKTLDEVVARAKPLPPPQIVPSPAKESPRSLDDVVAQSKADKGAPAKKDEPPHPAEDDEEKKLAAAALAAELKAKEEESAAKKKVTPEQQKVGF